MKTSTKGTINEKRAIIYFLKKGCVVCKNVEQHGPYDISVTHPDGATELLDVKTYLKRKRDGYPIHRSLTDLQKIKLENLIIILTLMVNVYTWRTLSF